MKFHRKIMKNPEDPPPPDDAPRVAVLERFEELVAEALREAARKIMKIHEISSKNHRKIMKNHEISSKNHECSLNHQISLPTFHRIFITPS